MARRVVLGFWLLLSVLVGTVLGAAAIALGTAAGRKIVVRAGLAFANRALDGTVTVGEVQGSLRRGLEAHDVSIVGSDSVPLARVPLLTVRYRLRDLLSGRIVLGQVSLSHPSVNVVQYPNRRFNYQKVFRLGGPPSGKTPPLVAFHDVTIDSASVVLRTRAGKGDTTRFEYVPEVDSGYRVRRFENLSTRISYLRLSSPFPGEKSILAEITELRARVSDPALVIRRAAGRAELDGDSVKVDFPSLVLGSSTTTLRGLVRWPRDTLMFNLVANTRDAIVDDIRPLVPIIPRGLHATGKFTIRSLAGDITAIGADNLSMVARREGGSLTGKAGIVLGPRSAWSVQKADLVLDNLDLEYVRPFLDTLPLAGRLTGPVKADGPHDRLSVEANVVFRDSLVPGWPESTIEAAGELATGTESGVVFHGLSISRSKIDLATVRRILPNVVLQGFVWAEGTLSGPWLEAEFNGTLRHADPPFPETVAHGVIQMDARDSVLGVWANLGFDSLNLGSFWTSYPEFRMLGKFAGNVRLEGYLDALHVVTDLRGPPGRVKGDGTLVLRSPRYAGRDLNFQFFSLDVRSLFTEPIPTHLNGTLRGSLAFDSLRPPTAKLLGTLDSSTIGGSPVDSARAVLSAADSVIRVDSLSAWAPFSVAHAHGGLGLSPSRRDSIVFGVELDSVRALEPVLAGWLELPEDTARRPLGGTVTLSGSLGGSLDDLHLTFQTTAPRVRWGQVSLASAQVGGTWSSKASGRASLVATVDSLRYGTLGFNFVVARAAGQRDSLRWILRGRNGPNAGVMAAGALSIDSAGTRIPLDSARFTLPSLRWDLEHPTTITIRDSLIDVDTLAFRGAGDSARVELVGSIPLEGHGRLSVTMRSLALQDIFAMMQKEPELVGGRLAGTIDIAGTARAPQMHSDITMSNVSYADFRVPAVQGTVDYAGRRLQGAFTLRNAQAVIMDIKGDLPLDLALRGATQRQLPGPLSIRAKADSVDLALLEAISTAVTNASGRLDGDFGIIGTWDNPQLSGSLTIQNGAATYPGIGARHEAINGRLVMHGDTLQVETLYLRSGSGSVKVGGNIRLAELTHPVLDLHFSAQDFFAMDVRNFVTVTTTGEFDLFGPMIGATLRGGGTVPRGTLHFADLLNKRIVNLEDTLFRAVIDTTLLRRQGLTRGFQNRFIDSLVVDSLRMGMGSEAWLRSTEANIQLSGTVVFSKMADQYRIEGTLSALRGTYQLPLGVQIATRQFTVSRGQLRFLGTPDLNALVDIDAQYVVRRRVGENINVTVHIGGTLYEPTVLLSSDMQPPLPESEIMAYLIFGGPLDPNAVGAQGKQALVQGAVSALYGQIENSLMSNLGLPIAPDYFELSPGEQGLSGTQVQFGWQIHPFGVPAFLTPSARICPGHALLNPADAGVSLEFRLSKEWRVASSVEPIRTCTNTGALPTGSRQFGVDVFWEKNY